HPLSCSSLFPYTTLFRSLLHHHLARLGWRSSARDPESACGTTWHHGPLLDAKLRRNPYRGIGGSGLRIHQPICPRTSQPPRKCRDRCSEDSLRRNCVSRTRSEEHTSELQSRFDLV